MAERDDERTVLLTGATGFVGRHALPALRAAGWRVRCGARDPARAALRDPESEWVRCDLDQPATLATALTGCRAALYLVHGMGAGRSDYPAREQAEALAFRAAAEAAGVRRVVYLGGVAPQGAPSKHLGSRLQTGEVLRGGALSAIELRAGMVIGVGSAGWQVTCDLARRLPAMLLPRWLHNSSWPVAIEDVVAALLLALELELPGSAWFDLPGPERVTYKELLRRVARAMGRRPLMIDVPALSPRLSSYWIGLVTRADVSLARELVEGLRGDLDPSGPTLWSLAPAHRLRGLDEAIADALRDEHLNETPGEELRERLVRLAREPLLVRPTPSPRGAGSLFPAGRQGC